jgi:RNA polymerase sigma-70 factor (ECF subfamily)
LPEPIVIDLAPDSAMLTDSLSFAFLTLLESLTPVERAVFLLREVFDYGYAEIATMVDKSAANCRQMVKRAKDHLAERRPRFDVRREEHERLLAEFGQACLTGNLNGLLAILADDVVGYSDGGGKTSAALNPIYGPDKVARYMLGVIKKLPAGFSPTVNLINGLPAIVGYVNSQPRLVLSLDIAEERIVRVYTVLNPDKLNRLPPQN